MAASLDLWLEYLIRFSHLVAGIAWIGSSFYFIWLDSSFETPENPRKNVEGELFMVHGGFYYQVEKKRIYPGELPKILHWFKWEATLTWLTGFLLLIYLYYLRGASLLIDSQIHPMSQTQAIALSIAIISFSWVIYDLIWHEKLKNLKWLSLILSAVLFSALVYFNTGWFSGRGAFIQTGVVLGSLMLLNVWVRILPGQSKMLREAQGGQVPDYSVSAKSKVRSVHNTYFTFPVLFIMLSNHYPLIYSHSQNWLLLTLLCIAGALVRHAMVTKKSIERWTLLPAAIALAALIFATAQSPNEMKVNSVVSDESVMKIVSRHCHSCHSSNPSDEVFTVAPKGVIFENIHQLEMMAEKVQLHVVLAKSMPLGNKTGMTDSERSMVAQWLKQKRAGD